MFWEFPNRKPIYFPMISTIGSGANKNGVVGAEL